LIAAAAGGHDLIELQEIFCRAAPGSSLVPDRSLAALYADALGRFQVLLDANR
jgi:hypothetical protein